MNSRHDYKNDVSIQWCPGCPNHLILNSLKGALEKLNKAPHEICLVSGIGQAAKFPHYLRCNFFNGLHGRALPAALGIRAANPELSVIVTTGDGDCYGEGGNHFIHTLRRNPDITVIVHNNEFYALTLGQASPTTRIGEKRTLQPNGVEIAPLNMPAIAISQNCSFVARGFAGEGDHLKDLLVEAIKHRGFSFVEVIQPCITWGSHPMSWYKERVNTLEKDYDPGNRDAALKKTLIMDEEIPIGILYKTSPKKVWASRYREKIYPGLLRESYPLNQEDMEAFLNKFKPGREFS
jgi:2-oxoglutarate ferredoxin oxidoreductase subunit beta